MNGSKRLKDPIYGYIDIPNEIMGNIVDTAAFQRLRRISQTSYGPLYSSAVHNRFVHSLGVFHLGSIASKTLHAEIELTIKRDHLDVQTDLKRLHELFLLACLLHDVGHAPFSHTGEMFYLENGQEYDGIHTLLIDIVKSNTFENDVPKTKIGAAAPHEIMSSIVGLKEFCSFFSTEEEREFFARCITGYKYSGSTADESIKNCFVLLLNSKVIDVDKLDYLIRDAFITGFNTVNIDYERLLTSLTITKANDEEYKYELAYYKGAISVIENVVYAHDSERKWIQSHPVILYESYILQHIMAILSHDMDSDENKLFMPESLSAKGQTLKDGTTVRLLSDDDIVHFMKCRYDSSSLVAEYFERRNRRHPLWKSEAEYRAFFLSIANGGDLLKRLENAMETTAKYLSKNTMSWVINEELIDIIQHELDELDTTELDLKSKETQRRDKTNILKIITCLKDYAEEVGHRPCDFVLLKSSQFNSGFSKPDFSATKIVFPVGESSKVVLFGENVSSICGIASERDNFFYLFYNRVDDEEQKLSINDLCSKLFKLFI